MINNNEIICKGCGKGAETSQHLFFNCKVLYGVWKEILKW